MRRWLLTLLLVILPTQVVWAAAAPYCGHEAAPVAQHVGHHEHQHDGAEADAAGSGKTSNSVGEIDVDCGFCHLFASASLPAIDSFAALVPLYRPLEAPPPRFDSHVPSGPERPDRAVPAAAVRFGGGVAVGLFSR